MLWARHTCCAVRNLRSRKRHCGHGRRSRNWVTQHRSAGHTAFKLAWVSWWRLLGGWNMVLFDNGRKLAERDFAKAMSKWAAVSLVQRTATTGVLTAADPLSGGARGAGQGGFWHRTPNATLAHFRMDHVRTLFAGCISDQFRPSGLAPETGRDPRHGSDRTEGGPCRDWAELSAMGVGAEHLARFSSDPHRLQLPLRRCRLPFAGARLAERNKSRAEAARPWSKGGFCPR